MRKLSFLSLFLCVLAATTIAQSPNFSGEWTADVKRSRFDDKYAELVSMSMSVTHTPAEIKWYKSAKVKQTTAPFELSDRSGSDNYALDGKPHGNQLYPTLEVTNQGVVEGAKITITKNYERKNALTNAVESRTRSFIILELIEEGKTLKVYRVDDGTAKPTEELYFARK